MALVTQLTYEHSAKRSAGQALAEDRLAEAVVVINDHEHAVVQQYRLGYEWSPHRTFDGATHQWRPNVIVSAWTPNGWTRLVAFYDVDYEHETPEQLARNAHAVLYPTW